MFLFVCFMFVFVCFRFVFVCFMFVFVLCLCGSCLCVSCLCVCGSCLCGSCVSCFVFVCLSCLCSCSSYLCSCGSCLCGSCLCFVLSGHPAVPAAPPAGARHRPLAGQVEHRQEIRRATAPELPGAQPIRNTGEEKKLSANDTAEIRVPAVQSPRFGVSGYCTK